MKAAIYGRQSLDVAEGISRQVARCKALIDARGWTEGEHYLDNDTSASKARGEGTAWARMLADAEAGRFDVLVAVNLDRLLRTQRDLTTLIEAGVLVTTLEGELDLASASGEMQASVLTAMARFEVRRKSERQVRANASKAQRGEWVGGRRPFGYESDGVTVRESEASAIRRGFRDLLLGVPLGTIARQWNEAGLSTGQKRQARSGNAGAPSPWRSQNVRFVLRNPRYAGLVRYRGEVMDHPAKWPPLVDLATFEAAQAILSDPTRRTPGRTATHLLTGIAFCGVCENPSTVHAGGNARPGVRAYRCAATTGHFARMADPVEDYVGQVVVARLSQRDAVDLLQKRPSVDTTALAVEATGLRARLNALAVDFADGSLTDSQIRTASKRIQGRLAEIDALLTDAGRVDVLGDLVGADDVAAAWDALPMGRKREVIRSLMRVTIYPPGRGTRTFRPETVGIEWLSEPT